MRRPACGSLPLMRHAGRVEGTLPYSIAQPYVEAIDKCFHVGIKSICQMRAPKGRICN